MLAHSVACESRYIGVVVCWLLVCSEECACNDSEPLVCGVQAWIQVETAKRIHLVREIKPLTLSLSLPAATYTLADLLPTSLPPSLTPSLPYPLPPSLPPSLPPLPPHPSCLLCRPQCIIICLECMLFCLLSLSAVVSSTFCLHISPEKQLLRNMFQTTAVCVHVHYHHGYILMYLLPSLSLSLPPPSP